VSYGSLPVLAKAAAAMARLLIEPNSSFFLVPLYWCPTANIHPLLLVSD